MSDRPQERRQAQRVHAHLNLKVKLPLPDGSEQAASLETLNISSSGVYFRSDHFIEPMTKLEMDLDLPVPVKGTAGELEIAQVRCEGLVVRVTPDTPAEGSAPYEIAVFFTNIEPEGLASLEEHIALLLA